MKKLELKHLAPYLPYRLKILDEKSEPSDNIFTLESVNIYESVSDTEGNIDISFMEIKPILKPISDLSTLVKDEFEKYDGIRSGKADEEIINLFCEENGVDELIENIELKSLPYECVEYMFRNHYDFFGLIDDGLAININEL